REAATAPLDSGNRAIVPGRPERSELLRRVTDPDPKRRMPQRGEALSPGQVENLRRWIAGGASWPRHWAYRPLVRPAPPAAPPGGRAHTPIDLFVLEKLAARRLRPSPPADKRTLLRRVYLDLIGLPPTPAETDAFLADPPPDAYD